MLAALGEIGVFGTKLLDHSLLRGDLFGERRLALPQNLGGRLQLLIGLLLPLPETAALVFDLLKLRRDNLLAAIQLRDAEPQVIDEMAGLSQDFIMRFRSRALGRHNRRGQRINGLLTGIEASDASIGQRHEARRRLQ